MNEKHGEVPEPMGLPDNPAVRRGGVYPTLQANSNGGRNRQGVCYLILNDQGGGVMSVSKDTVSTLRAQMKHHEPIVCYEPVQCAGFNGKAYSLNAMHGHDVHVICFEPGIAKREGSNSRFVMDKCGTLRADMGDNQPAVCIALEGNGARPSHRGGGYSDCGQMFTLNTIERHSVCYSVDCRNLYMNEQVSGTLQAKNEGGHSLNFINPILRKL